MDYLERIKNEASRLPVRMYRPQKRRFQSFLMRELAGLGYASGVVATGTGANSCENVVSACEKPKLILMAHYDTPGIMPQWIHALARLLGHTPQLLVAIALIAVINAARELPPGLAWIHTLLMASLFLIAVPNPRNSNDNTSGTLCLLDIARKAATDPELRNSIQFVFTDKEELGLLGAYGLKKRWEDEGRDLSGAAIVSIDCVGRGHIPLVIRNGRSELADGLLASLAARDPAARSVDMGFIPLSDSYAFRKTGAVNLSFASRPLAGFTGYYLPAIHQPWDSGMRLENVDWLSERMVDYAATLQASTHR